MPPTKIWLSSPHMGANELKYVQDAFATNWIAPLGPHVDGFEQDLQNFTGVKHAAALSSGTAAIHLALVILGVQPGDLVICQSFTFSGSVNPIAYLGATPVFVDSEKETWNICPQALEEAILACESGKVSGKKQKPAAIIPVHLYGMPAKMQEIMALARKYDIPVIEDAAEALGSTFKGKACGTFGDMGVLSFNGNKIITTSGGGALLSDTEWMVKKAKFLATQARDEAPHYQHTHIGYNYRMSNVLAGIGRGQMEVLPERVAQRRRNFDYYKRGLGNLSGISFLEEPEGFHSNRWLTCMLVDPEKTGGITREDIRKYLWEDNIESRPLWKPMHLQPVFKNAPYYGGKVAEKLFENGLCLPSGSNLREEDLERVVSKIKEVCLKGLKVNA
ncbi:DegT/DnrJ/EryC1/StrS family aminotransferase [Cecembia calidifontis]|uniref:GDP-perosamine synthase n=1 Tax=Cecembia calidifontis TaxID=1187080 RepID=A0A4Q7PHQ7_9BACT|nr:aminotransferase class I/II-fold pyridoxal phosphate-dependent enzyme [Cecembia calidifontis]RZS98452.1 dTDP-4-amino-4,6-dideoxygalactose transaminase [Cecembia calidifontis]